MERVVFKKSLLFLAVSLVISCGGPSASGEPDGVDAVDHRLFVSSTTNTGKFEDGSLEGLAAADKFCNDLAEDVNLTRDYKAVMSDSITDAKTRLFITGAIYTVAGSEKTLIAESATDFWNASATDLKNNISRDETGAFLSGNDQVWTGSSSAGTKNTTHCSDWKVEEAGVNDPNKGTVGELSRIDGLWIDNTTEVNCNLSLRVYCISQ